MATIHESLRFETQSKCMMPFKQPPTGHLFDTFLLTYFHGQKIVISEIVVCKKPSNGYPFEDVLLTRLGRQQNVIKNMASKKASMRLYRQEILLIFEDELSMMFC